MKRLNVTVSSASQSHLRPQAVSLWDHVDLRVAAPPAVEESDHSDAVVLLVLLLSKCLTFPSPPTERIRRAEYVQQSHLWHEHHQW